MLIATPSVHGYTFLFLVPSLLAIRRDFAFVVAAFYLGVYHTDMWWIGCSLAVGCLLAANRWPRLRVAAVAIKDTRSGGTPAPSRRRGQDSPIQSSARYNLLDLASMPSTQPRSS